MEKELTMGSSLLRKLNLMNAGAPAPQPKRAAHVMIREHSCAAEPHLFALNQNALLRMGLTGGRFDINKAVFIDTETTGLSGGAGTVAFLVGYGYTDKDRFTVKQLLMPDYSAEPEMLEYLSRELSRFETAVHFNGRRFDMPLLRERCIMKRLPDMTEGMEEIDLLYPARAVWKLRLGSCRLSYLESAVLGLPERDDIPGGEIPARYFESVRRGDVSLLEDVIQHNRQDIVTLTLLLCALEKLYTRPEDAQELIDTYSLGRAFERQGELRTAKGLYLKASRPRPVRSARDFRNELYAGEANRRLFLLYRRAKEYEKCEQTLLYMIKRAQAGLWPYLELCKLYEHRLKSYERALEQCDYLISRAPAQDRAELNRRRQRIQGKLLKTKKES
ncbi:MAG: ribonuclease H-like domain-containing protein [Clostridia bacterium]|nr:ribonuclease H-like domain-containing protein [Clostridia bacterium]